MSMVIAVGIATLAGVFTLDMAITGALAVTLMAMGMLFYVNWKDGA